MFGKVKIDMKKEMKINFDYAVGVNRWSMRLLGLWPLDTQYSTFTCSINFTLITIFILPLMAHLLTLTDWESIINQALRTITYFPLLMKFILMKVNAKKLRIILNMMIIDWTNYRYLTKQKQEIMIYYAKKGRQINLISIVWIMSSIMAYTLTPLLHVWMNNLSWNATKKLPNEGFYPFSAEQSPVFEIIYASQSIVMYLCGVGLFSIDSLFCIIVFHACGQFDVLATTLKRYDNFIKHDYTKDVRCCACACLSCIVKRHVYIVKYMDIVERSYSTYVLLQLLGNYVTIALQGYELAKHAQDSNIGGVIMFIFYMIMMTYGVFTYCYTGEYIIEKSENIGRTAYNLEWNYFSRSSARPIILLIRRSRTPCKITAGRFATMSLSYYKTILMTSISYISVLKAVK